MMIMMIQIDPFLPPLPPPLNAALDTHTTRAHRLVGEVDEELLEGVVLEGLEAVDVQHAHETPALVRGDGGVEPPHQPVEDARVDGLGQRVALVRRLARVVGLDQRLVPPRVDLLGAERAAHLLGIEPQEARRQRQVLLRRRLHHRPALVCVLEAHVAQVQHRRDELEHGPLQARVDADGSHARLGHLEVVRVRLARDVRAVPVRQVAEAARPAGVVQAQVAEQLLVASADELVEDVEVALLLLLPHDARLLQQVVGDLRAHDPPRVAELDLHVLPEAAAGGWGIGWGCVNSSRIEL
jgi:hypothetical protein